MTEPSTKKQRIANFKDEIINNPLFLFLTEENVTMSMKMQAVEKQLEHMTRTIDRIVEEKRHLRQRLDNTQRYVMEMESRHETLKETVVRLVERESFHVVDAVQATVQQQLLEQGEYAVGSADLVEVLDLIDNPSEAEMAMLVETLFDEEE